MGTNVAAEIVDVALTETFRALTKYDRVPFRKLLAQFLDCAPTAEGIRAAANHRPDQWAAAVSILAGLSGFDKGLGMTVNIYNLEKLSDSELDRRLRELERAAAAKDVTPHTQAKLDEIVSEVDMSGAGQSQDATK